MVLSLAAGCAFLTRSHRPPHAPQTDAGVELHWGIPKDRVILSGAWLRATTMALDDFLPADEAERAHEEGAEAECLAQRDNYVAWVWEWSPKEKEDADGGALEADGGVSQEDDAGYSTDSGYGDAFDQPGMRKTPAIIYVSVFLLPGRCQVDGAPLMDMGASYAIDTMNWQILA